MGGGLANLQTRTGLTVLLMVFWSGCTFYGQNNSTSLIQGELNLTAKQVQDSYVRAHATLDRFVRAARADDSLEPLVRRYRAILQTHAQLVTDLDSWVLRLEHSSDYRRSSASLRAAIAGRMSIFSAYDEVGTALVARIPGYEAANPIASDAESILIPPYYRARQSAVDRYSVIDGLRANNQ